MRHALFPAGLLSLLFLLSLSLTLINLHHALPQAEWWQAFWSPAVNSLPQMVFHYSLLPRTALALLVGAGLGLAGLLFQQILRNPLAEPTTLGVSSGAQLGIAVATLWQLPGGALTQQFAALSGALLVGALVFGVAWGKRLSPVTLILAVMVLSLYSGPVHKLFAILNHHHLLKLFLLSTRPIHPPSLDNVHVPSPTL